jgi:hypothetical protein
MITQAQIDAEDQTPALTDQQVLTLTLLVKRAPVYYSNVGLFPNLSTKLTDEQTTPTVITQALKAILTALGDIPEIVVESQGSRDAESHFSTNENWVELAVDVLNLFYTLAGVSRQSYAITRDQLKAVDLLANYKRNTVKI